MELSKNQRKGYWIWNRQDHIKLTYKKGQLIWVEEFYQNPPTYDCCDGCKGCIKTKETKGKFQCISFGGVYAIVEE